MVTCSLLAVVLCAVYMTTSASGFTLTCSMASNSKLIYNIPNSGWSSPEWNWGYASGTGHDCALICRRQYATRESRAELVQNLLNPSNKEPPFEEVKLVLGLAWQRGRWDGSDGGRGGYGEVLAQMAQAERYEIGSEEECSRMLVQDMADRFDLLGPTDAEKKEMQSLSADNFDAARRKCAGLVLQAMGFVDSGL